MSPRPWQLLAAVSVTVLIGCVPPEQERVVLDCEDPEAGGWSAEMAPDEEQILVAANDWRALGALCAGVEAPPVAALTMNPELRCAARSHAVDMAVRGYFDHLSPEGVSPGERAEEAGYSWRALSENISEGRSSAAETVDGLIASTSGHCENLMDEDPVEAGMGAHFDGETWWWVQLFGAPR